MATEELQQSPATWRSGPWWPAAFLVLVQTINGIWYMPQLNFFPIYLQERVGLEPVVIGSLVAASQVAGMFAALLGGSITGLLGSKWVLVCGLALSAIASLAFQTHVVWLVALLWFFGGAGLALITVGGASYLTRLSIRGTLGMLAAVYVMSMTIGGAIGNPLAGLIIESRGFGVFGWAEMAVILAAALVATFFLLYLGDRTAERTSPRELWCGMLAVTGRLTVRMLMGLRALPTIFYGMLSVLVPLLLNDVSGSKATVAVFGTTNLILASAAQLLAGRAADRWGARGPTLVAFSMMVISGLGLAAFANTVWGLFVFGVLGVAAAWSLSTLMYLWVSDGVPKDEHASSFGLLHAVWSLSIITGSLLGGWLVKVMAGLPFLLAGLFNAGALFLTVAYYRRTAAPGNAPTR